MNPWGEESRAVLQGGKAKFFIEPGVISATLCFRTTLSGLASAYALKNFYYTLGEKKKAMPRMNNYCF